MNRHPVHITGLPYFPGLATALLAKGTTGDIASRILLISPDEAAGLNAMPAGLIVVGTAPFSHTMIGLLGLGVPTVLINAEQAAVLEQDTRLLIDGNCGLITDNLAAVPAMQPVTPLASSKPVLTADGDRVELMASVRQPAKAGQARALGASAIGLVRSEFLLPEDGRLPDVDFYRQAFREIAEAAAPLAVTFRLLDVAADKQPPWLTGLDGVGQTLGMQGVRLYNQAPVDQIINAQLTALAELSQEMALRVLLPYLVRLEEYDYWRARVRQSLPEVVAVGAMAETPAMVLEIDRLLAHADFVCIGCNDLMQTVYAADRDCPELGPYLDPYAPLLYRLFRQVAQAAGEHLGRVALVGLLAQIQGVLPVLIGLGYRRFSVDAPFIPHLAQTVSGVTQAECEALARQVCEAETTQQVLAVLGLSTDRQPPFFI